MYSGYCLESSDKKMITASNLQQCCSAAHDDKAYHFTYFASNSSCELFGSYAHASHCPGATTGSFEGPSHQCNCTRLYETVGRENLTTHYSSSMHPAGGEWYSHPAGGECKAGQVVGDGSGCTWRLVEQTRAIMAYCMYNRIDTHIEQQDPTCFQGCSQPQNRY